MTAEENKVRSLYFDWLCSQAHPETGESEITPLFRFGFLFQTEFYELIPNDQNRATEGKNLRSEWANEIGDASVLYLLDGPCTVLEMMIAIARRMSEMMADWVEDSSVGRWFDEMVTNLVIYDRGNNFQTAVRKMVERRFDSFGRGSLFPMMHPDKDMRKVEIWYQANKYLIEKYMSDDL